MSKLKLFFLGLAIGSVLGIVKVGADILKDELAPTKAVQSCEMRDIHIDEGYGVSAIAIQEVCE